MNKRITSLLLCFVMIFSMMVSAVPAYAAGSTQLKVTPNKTEANPGDIITYTITLGPVSELGTIQMVVDIPTGLTYVANSGKLADGISTTLGFDIVEWTEESARNDPEYPGSMISGCASAADYSSGNDTVLATFQCKVNDGFTGTVKVGLKKLEFYSCQTWEDHTSDYSVVPTAVTVAAAPVAVTGVTIDETLSVNIGQTKTPSFTVAPAEATNKSVSFTSNNPAVATVNATTGAVTGVSKGTAVITVKTADGNFTDTCTVTVSCAHTNKSTVPAQNSTCTVKGWDEYKECDDCGQLFNTSDVEINEVPFRNLADHTEGTTATCTAKAVCSVCHQPYGNYGNHSYTAETKKAEALKTGGNCRDKAVYYYSCSVCGNVEHNDAHTFLGDKNASVHVGGTSTVNASEPDHKNQIDGYTGDTKCLGCNEIIANGTSIPAGAHTPSSTWNSNETHHWKECTTMGCGVVIDGSKAEHSSTGANVATCQHKAVCDICNVEYGALAAHNPASGWTSDASGHWHACQTANCTEKCDFASHTPDHTGHATEEYAIKCTECGYVIETQLGHTHVFDKEVATDTYKASDATCTAKATYYKSCVCGAKGTTTFEYGELGAHNWTPATCSISGQLVSKADCTNPDVYKKYCKECMKLSDETFKDGKANGHTEVVDKAVLATEEATGLTEGSHCSVCNIVIKKQEIVPMLEKKPVEETKPEDSKKPEGEDNRPSEDKKTVVEEKVTEDGHKTDYIENATEWTVAADGNTYWYEDGYRQGYDSENPAYRGKEIFDSKTNAWYWLDNVQGGAKAVSKDVYQESAAGIWAASEDGTGKWVRYDANGLMIKGWCSGSGEDAKAITNPSEAGDKEVYYFDYTYGTMAKGFATIDGKEYHFDEATGVMDKNYKAVEVKEKGWVTVNGKQFWYEESNRQGYNASNSAYRGKEIYDPESNAWYWLDNVQNGAKAVSKDVYQESLAGEWGATTNEAGEKIGKWVRYDANGLMIKGWCSGKGADAKVISNPSEANGADVYYFDLTYGTMAKGTVAINGVTYTFDENTGILKK